MSLEGLLEEVKALDRRVQEEQARYPDLWREHPGFKEIREHLADAKVVLQILKVSIAANPLETQRNQ